MTDLTDTLEKSQPKHSAHKHINNALIENLIDVLGEDIVIVGVDIQQRACSYWDSSPTQAKALLLPRNTQQVSQALKICHQMGQTVITHGGLTGCVEGAHSHADDVIISLERMTEIEEIDEIGSTAVIQSGAVLQTIQDTVEAKNLYFPLDLGARGSCTIGGNVATNAGGINVLRYGMTRNLVLGLEAVLADGTIISSMNQMLKNNAGYDTKQLFIGSEGTLGIVTRVIVKLFPKPSSLNTALVVLDNFDQVAALLKTMNNAMAGTLSAFEIMWGDYFQTVTEPGKVAPPKERDHPFYVLLEARGNNQQEDTERFEKTLEQAFSANEIVDVVIPSSEAQRAAIWDVREGFEVILNEPPVFMYDVSLPIKNMAAYVDTVKANLRNKWSEAECYVFGHVADGNLHIFVQPQQQDKDRKIKSETKKDEAALRLISDECIYEPLKAINGSVSAEHGIGTEKKAWLNHCRTEEEIQLMRMFKQSLDPKNLLNPGVIFDLT